MFLSHTHPLQSGASSVRSMIICSLQEYPFIHKSVYCRQKEEEAAEEEEHNDDIRIHIPIMANDDA